MINALITIPKIKGALTSNFLHLSFINPFSFLEIASRILPHKSTVALIHSASLNRQLGSTYPRSIDYNVTNREDALKLFDEMSQRHPLPSISDFNQLLHAVTKMKHYSISLDIFKQMIVIGVPVNLRAINVVARCCCQLHRTREGFAVLGYAFKSAVLPDVRTFNTLLNGLVLEDRVLEAEMLFKELIKKKICEPNVVMYNTMIKGLCKFGNNDTAISLLRLMDERGCKPNVVTYSTVIDSLCKDKMVEDALELFKVMVFHEGIHPDVITYSSLIHGLCNLGRWDDVRKMFKEMEDQKITPDVHTFTILINALCMEGMVEDAEAVLKTMVERGKNPNVVTYSSLIDGYCLRGEITKAAEIFYSMGFRGLVPDIITCTSLLNGYCKKLKIDEALHLFHNMREKGFHPDAVTYRTILQGLFDAGRCRAAYELLDEMRANGHSPDECTLTYRIILKGLCDNRRFDEAYRLFQSIGDDKLNLDIRVYTILIDGGGKCGKKGIASILYNDLAAKGLQPDVRTHNVMISSLCWEGLVMEAKKLLLKMEEIGCPANRVTYTLILQGCLKNKYYDEVEGLLKEMERNHFALDAAPLTLLVDGIAAGSLDKTLLQLISKLVGKELVDAPGRDSNM